jgi:hypothetical protein
MRLLYVKKLYLWPRFHQAVIEDLQAHQPEVIELHQPMTPLMSSIQECIVEIMRACLQELKSSNQVANTHTRTLSLLHTLTKLAIDINAILIRWISHHSKKKADSFETLSM